MEPLFADERRAMSLLRVFFFTSLGFFLVWSFELVSLTRKGRSVFVCTFLLLWCSFSKVPFFVRRMAPFWAFGLANFLRICMSGWPLAWWCFLPFVLFFVFEVMAFGSLESEAVC